MFVTFRKFSVIAAKYSWNYSRSCSTSVPYVEVPSALHLTLKNRKNVFHSLSPHLDNFDYFEDINVLHSELMNRGLDISLDYLREMKEKCYLHYEVSRSFNKLKLERDSIGQQIKSLKNSDMQMKKTALLSKLHECSEQVVVLQEKMDDLENTFILPFLQLPNRLHPSTSIDDVDIHIHSSKPHLKFVPKSHLSIGLNMKQLLPIDVSPNSCYLSGVLAILELALSDFILSQSKKFGFRPLSVTDFAKAVLAEGCGIDVKNNENIFEIYEWDCVSSSLKTYLLGGASLPSCVALICKLIKNPNFTRPFKSVSVGRKYVPMKIIQKPNLYNTPQTTTASAFILHSCLLKEEKKMLTEVMEIIIEIYSQLGLHFKLTSCAASKLHRNESHAIRICLFSPFIENYVEVGRISLCSDYISKRLQCIEGLGNQQGAFLGMIHVEVMNITKWMACMLENTQTIDGNYFIPKCLEPHMFETKWDYR